MARRVFGRAEFDALKSMRRSGIRPCDLALATGRRPGSISRITRRAALPIDSRFGSSERTQ